MKKITFGDLKNAGHDKAVNKRFIEEARGTKPAKDEKDHPYLIRFFESGKTRLVKARLGRKDDYDS